VTFQSHHKEHRDALIATIRKLGGLPVAAKPDAEVAKALNASSLKNQTDVLRLAQKLERGAANAYLGVIPSFSDKGLSQVSAKLASDETGHWMVLSQALGDAISPKAFYVG
jgi:rubrerythrin